LESISNDGCKLSLIVAYVCCVGWSSSTRATKQLFSVGPGTTGRVPPRAWYLLRPGTPRRNDPGSHDSGDGSISIIIVGLLHMKATQAGMASLQTNDFLGLIFRSSDRSEEKAYQRSAWRASLQVPRLGTLSAPRRQGPPRAAKGRQGPRWAPL